MRRLFIGLAVVLAALVLPPGMLGNLRDGAVIVWNGPRHPPSEVRVYKQTPTRPLEINIFLPEPGTAPGATVVLFHGGGFHSGWPDELFPLATELARAGHHAFVPEYRLQRQDGVSYAEALEDSRDAIAWVEREATAFGADPGRLVIGGSSARAHLAAALVTLPRPDGEPFSDALGLLLIAPYVDSSDASESFAARASERSWISTILLAPPVDVFEGRSRDYSPREYLHAEMPPVLAMAGEHDRLWPPARAFCDALQLLGPDCTARSYPNAGHAFALVGYDNYPAFVADVLDAIDGWLAEEAAAARAGGSSATPSGRP
jgi:acetyl esterase/lipase